MLTPEVAAQEYTIPAMDEVDGEILVTVPKDATPGQRQLVTLIAEVSGETGVYEGQNMVSISRGGGVKPGQTALTGTTTVGVSRLTPSGADARSAGGVALSGKLDANTTVSLSGGRDLNDTVTNYRYNVEPTRVTGTVRRNGLDVTFGNMLSSAGTTLTGPGVRARGATVRQTTGPFIGDVTIAQPTTYTGEASGYLLRGRAGLNRAFGSISFVASDFSRPTGYTALPPPVTVLDPDEAERQAIERRLAESQARNRVIGLGVETELRRGQTQRLTTRVGALSLSNSTGLDRTAPAAEVGYGYNSRDWTLNLRWRDMPESMQGVQIGGDEIFADTAVRIVGELRLTAQHYALSYNDRATLLVAE